MEADFLDESIFHVGPRLPWKIYFDGSHIGHGSEAGILFITFQGDSIPKSFHIAFPCTNNFVEYEALLIGLRRAVQWKIKELVFGDSQLVINQFNDDYDTKDEKMIPYKCMVDSFLSYFHMISFEQIPRAQNKETNVMTTIGSLLDIPNNVSQFKFLVE